MDLWLTHQPSKVHLLGLVLAALPIVVIMNFFRKNHFDVAGKTVLLTGASEGMGKAVAEQLAAKGAHIVIASRNPAKLEAAMVDIKKAAASPTQRFHHVAGDMSKAADIERVLAECREFNHGSSPDVVWCIAGVSYPRLFLESPVEEMRHQMDVNFWSCVEMSQAILKDWLAPVASGNVRKDRDTKHLIFTSSIACFASLAGYGPYSPGKAAIRSLSDTLAQEVRLYTPHTASDVKIHTVFPGNIDSPGHVVETTTKPEVTKLLEEDDPMVSSEEVARLAIAGLERGDYFVTMGWIGALLKSGQLGQSASSAWDILLAWLVPIVWLFVLMDMNGKVKKVSLKGHPTSRK